MGPSLRAGLVWTAISALMSPALRPVRTSAATGRVPACSGSPKVTMPTSCWRRLRTRAPNLILLHQARGVLDVLILEPIDHVQGHHVADLHVVGIAARCHRPHRDITIRQACRPGARHHRRKRADIEMAHRRSAS